MSLHEAAAVGFARSAQAYERGRPGYPGDAVDRLAATLPGRRVIDLAAGRSLVRRTTRAGGVHRGLRLGGVASGRVGSPRSARWPAAAR